MISQILLHQNILQPHLFSEFNFDSFESLKTLPSNRFYRSKLLGKFMSRDVCGLPLCRKFGIIGIG